MKRLRKILFWCTVIIIVLLSATYFFAPKLINSELLKGKIENIASEKVKGDVQFQSLDLSLFPRPHATIHQGSISTDEAIGTIGSLSIYPEMLPLLIGKLEIRKLLVESPDIQMSLSSEAKKTQTTGTFPLKAISKKVAAYLAAPLVLDNPDLVVVMGNGNLNIIKENVSVFSMENINSEVVFPPKGLTVIKAKIASSMFKLSVQHDNKDLVIKGSSLKGRVYHDKDKTSISLTELIFDYPRLKLAGALSSDNDSQSVSLSLEGKQVDAQSVREVALALAGSIPVTQKIFKIVKGGNISSITFNSKASSFAGLRKLKNIVIKGSMSEGEIFVPKVNLDLKAVKGEVVISQGILKGENFEAQLQNSHAQEGTLEIELQGKGIPFHLDIMIQAELAELHPLLKRLIKNKAFVEELALISNPIGKASGRLVLGESLQSLKARVEISDVNFSAHYRRYPYPLKISTGSFYYDHTRVTVKNLHGKAGKSSFSDINFQVNLRKKPFFDISLGEASIFMDETYPWLSKLTSLPSEYVITSPLNVKQSNLLWDKGDQGSFTGNLSLQDGPHLSFDIYHRPGELKINKLAVKDKESDALFSLNLTKKEIGLQFTGNLTKATVDKILSNNKFLTGWIKGDFETRIFKNQPIHSTAQGKLGGEGIVLPLKPDQTANIKSIFLEAEKGHIKVDSVNITLGGIPLKLNGDINAAEEEFVFDIEAVTDSLEFENLKNTFSAEDTDKKHFYGFPIKGLIKLKSASFAYDKFIWKPFNADIAIDRDNINIAVIESDLCGISFPGNFEITPLQMSLGFEPVANNKDLESAIACLFGVTKRSTGSFDLQGKVTGGGEGEDLLSSLTGNLKLTAENGRIYQGGVLAKILAFINITEIFRGKMPDLVQEGFAYKSITADGELHGDTLTLKEIIIDGSSMKIVSQGDINIKEKKLDIEVLVAPLKTADFFIEKIPLIKDITKGTLISIPIKVTGDINNPKITFLSASSLGSSLSNILKKTVTSPFKILKPNTPDADKK